MCAVEFHVLYTEHVPQPHLFAVFPSLFLSPRHLLQMTSVTFELTSGLATCYHGDSEGSFQANAEAKVIYMYQQNTVVIKLILSASWIGCLFPWLHSV